MTTFLKLTDVTFNEQIYINPNLVCSFNSLGCSTQLTLTHQTIMVKETPEQIIQMLRECYCTVKE